MGKRRKEHPEDNIFVNKPFIEEFSDWTDSPEGELWTEICDTLDDLLKDVQLDAKQRQFIWPDADRLDLEQSVQGIHKQYPDFPCDKIEEFLIDWIDMGYAPENYSQAQLEHFSIRLGVARVCEISFAFVFGNLFEKRGDCSPKRLNGARLHFA